LVLYKMNQSSRDRTEPGPETFPRGRWETLEGIAQNGSPSGCGGVGETKKQKTPPTRTWKKRKETNKLTACQIFAGRGRSEGEKEKKKRKKKQSGPRLKQFL